MCKHIGCDAAGCRSVSARYMAGVLRAFIAFDIWRESHERFPDGSGDWGTPAKSMKCQLKSVFEKGVTPDLFYPDLKIQSY